MSVWDVKYSSGNNKIQIVKTHKAVAVRPPASDLKTNTSKTNNICLALLLSL